MAETFTMNEAPADPEILNSDEQDSLAVAESLEQDEQPLLAGKFKDQQSLEQAYVELQKKLGDQSEEQESEESEEEDSSTESLLDQLWDQAQSGDEFDEQTLQDIAKSDPSELARLYLDYRNKAEADKPRMTEEFANGLKNAVGGEQGYNDMIGWAGQNLTDQEIEAYDSIMENGDPAAAYWAVQALSYRYQDANGVEGNLVQGKAPTSSGNTFRSQAEVVQAMSDPRYDKDPAYRRDVMQRLQNSDVEF